MSMEKIAKRHHELMMMAQQLKALQNQTKIELGIILDELQTFHKEMDHESIDYFSTFLSTLATLHLNMRRTIPLIRNSRYALETKIPVENYKYYDSSLLNEIRKKQKNPNEYLDDIKAGVSYTDFIL